jgi:hypothetical protein
LIPSFYFEDDLGEPDYNGGGAGKACGHGYNNGNGKGLSIITLGYYNVIINTRDNDVIVIHNGISNCDGYTYDRNYCFGKGIGGGNINGSDAAGYWQGTGQGEGYTETCHEAGYTYMDGTGRDSGEIIYKL